MCLETRYSSITCFRQLYLCAVVHSIVLENIAYVASVSTWFFASVSKEEEREGRQVEKRRGREGKETLARAKNRPNVMTSGKASRARA